MKTPTSQETAAERLARAAALQAGVVEGFARRAAPRTPVDGGGEGPTCPGLSPSEQDTLAKLDLHARRYGLTHFARAELRKMGARDLAAVADAPWSRLTGWLGNREAEGVRARLSGIVSGIRAGDPEPGVVRMHPPLDEEARTWLGSRPVEDLAGRGVPARVPASLRAVGHATLLAVALEEADAVEDVHGIGLATVEAVRRRLAGIVSEGADAPSRRRRRRMSAEDAEWDAAAPDD